VNTLYTRNRDLDDDEREPEGREREISLGASFIVGIFFALVLIGDLLRRIPWLREFYTNAGVLHRNIANIHASDDGYVSEVTVDGIIQSMVHDGETS